MSSDDEALKRLREGDENAWAQLHREQYPKMWATVNRILNSASLADDVVQEAFVKAHREIGRFDGRAQVGTWLYRIAINTALDHSRKHTRRGKVLSFFSPLKSDEESGEMTVPEMPVAAETSKGLEHADIRKEITEAMSKLTPEHRAVVQLRLVEELSPKETATALGLREGTVNSRLFYACDQLRKILKKD